MGHRIGDHPFLSLPFSFVMTQKKNRCGSIESKRTKSKGRRGDCNMHPMVVEATVT